MAERHVSIPRAFANGDACEWFKRFEICSKANNWRDEMKALKLPTLLEGEALAIWLELSEEEQGAYETAKVLLKKMTPPEFVTLEEFHKRTLKLNEPLSLFTNDLKKLLEQAMPGIDDNAREQLLIHQFIAGLPEPIAMQIRATGDVKKLASTVEKARLLMTVSKHGQTAAITERTSEDVRKLEGQLASLTEQIAVLQTNCDRPVLRCYNCNRPGYLQRDCQSRRRNFDRKCFICQRTGHFARNCPQQIQGNDKGTALRGQSHPYRQ